MLSAFVLFCLSCALTGIGINYFLFRSTVPMAVTLDVGRGTASYIDSDLVEKVVPRDSHYVSTNEKISTDRQSQAVLFVHDTYQNRLIAAITMKNGTSLNFDYALRPRFEWSTVDYRIDLTNVTGELDIFVPPSLGRAFWLSLQTAENTFVYITSAGQYAVIVSSTQVQVFNRSGQAVMIAPDSTARDVPLGQRAVLTLTPDGSEIALMPAPLNLLQNSKIETMTPDELKQSTALLADLVQPWQCADISSNPPGEWTIEVPSGRPAVRLTREDEATNHGETFCFVPVGPGQTGVDVSSYKDLRLKVAFEIDDQSVTGCGVDGSECPLMLQIDYTFKDAAGKESATKWYHGFYTNYDVQSLYPLRCSSCLYDHESVYAHTWYLYESSNLLDLMPENQQPFSILRVRMYASGHQYDTYVGDVALYAS